MPDGIQLVLKDIETRFVLLDAISAAEGRP